MVEQESGLTLTRLLQIARRSWIIVVALAVIGGAGAYFVSNAQTPIFTSSASVYFALRQGTTSTDLNQGSAYTQAQMLSFAALATSSITLDRVIDDLGLDISSQDLARNIKVSIPQNTVILDIASSSTSPAGAARVANSVASNLAEVVVELAPSTKNFGATVSARVIEPAVAPTVQASPNKTRDTLLGVILGLLVGLVGCVLFALLDTRIRSADALGRTTALPLLGQIGRFPLAGDLRPAMVRAPNGAEAESYRRVRAGLRLASVHRDVRIILVTSGLFGEGKSTLSVNLALAMAETGARVLLVDADLRRPRVAKFFGLEGAVGLTAVLSGSVALEDARRRYGTTTLDLLLSGDVPPIPSELLSSSKMSQVLQEMASKYDVVIVDTAPVLAVPDAALLSQHADLTLLVVSAVQTRQAQVARAIRSLEIAGARISGVVLNRVRMPRRRDAYYYDPPANSDDSVPLVALGTDETAPGTDEVGATGSAETVTEPAVEELPVDDAVDERADMRESDDDSGREVQSATSNRAPMPATRPAQARKPRMRWPNPPKPRSSVNSGDEGQSTGE